MFKHCVIVFFVSMGKSVAHILKNVNGKNRTVYQNPLDYLPGYIKAW